MNEKEFQEFKNQLCKKLENIYLNLYRIKTENKESELIKHATMKYTRKTKESLKEGIWSKF